MPRRSELVYEAASPAIAMGAVWLVFVLDCEYPLRRWLAGHPDTSNPAVFLLRTLRTRSSKLVAQSAALGERDVEFKNSHGDSSAEDARDVVNDRAAIDAATAALRKWDVVALEAGIIFHSILIGDSLLLLASLSESVLTRLLNRRHARC